jgi:carboxylesterase type B
MQYNHSPAYGPMSEDCLNINVVRPKQGACGAEPLPVTVWIYSGGSADPSKNLNNFVYQSVQAGKPVVAVSLNYRLTALGFLWGDDPGLRTDSSANNGLRDQRLSLHWIQENIAAFGGDPTRVTIWGEGSGALSVGKHMSRMAGVTTGCFEVQSCRLAAWWRSGHTTLPMQQPTRTGRTAI